MELLDNMLCEYFYSRKRCRVEEAAAVDVMMRECDTTADDSDEAYNCIEDATDEDKHFMKIAQDVAKISKDKRTKVILVWLVIELQL